MNLFHDKMIAQRMLWAHRHGYSFGHFVRVNAKRHSLLLAVLVVFGSVAFACAPEPTAKTLKKCPSGHPALKDVPIAYGLPPLEGPEADEWRRGLEDLDFVSGGCVMTNDSPKHEVVCTVCRFTHSIVSTRTPEDGSWTRSSQDLKSFPKRLSAITMSFPIPPKEQQTESVLFTQSFTDRMALRFECVGYRTTLPFEEIKSGVDKWLSAQGIKCKFSSRVFTSTLDGAVRDIFAWETDELSVAVNMQHEHSDNTSWVHATLFKHR